MLSISQLAAYVGVTVAAVRHYHKIGLLPEPERDFSGYRRYDADAVVRLIKIRVLADAGVPLARVEQLLDADADTFAAAITDIDHRLRDEQRRLRDTRARLAELAGGDQIALPECVVGYLDRLRGLGVAEEYLARERDAWILVAAQMPGQIDAIIAGKHRYLDDPDMVRFYLLLGSALTWAPDEPQLAELADLLVRLEQRILAADMLPDFDADDALTGLLDGMMVASGPTAERLLELLEERGWKGWTRLEPIDQ